jgi:DEAD/DEAH box helicase domain-containing protein
VDPGNLHILRGHLQAAAYEAPLSDADTRYFGLGLHMVVREMLESGSLRRAGERYVHAGREYPAGDINLRSASGDAFQIVEAGQGRRMGTEQIEKVFHTLHPGAVYLHLGESFLVERLDIPGKTAWVTRTDVNYYTQTRETSTVSILDTEASRAVGRAASHFGPVRVTNTVLSYSRKQHFSDAVLGTQELDLPPLDFDTEALWFSLPEWAVKELVDEGVSIPAGLHAIEHATIGLMPLYAMCDRNDIGGVSYARHPEIGLPAVFIHDAHPGGVGIAERCFDMLEALLRSTRDHIAACPCRDGCPSCIQSPKCGNNNETLDKDAALRILDLLVGKSLVMRALDG